VDDSDRLKIDVMKAAGDGPRRIRRYLTRQGYGEAEIDKALASTGAEPARQGSLRHAVCRLLGVAMLLAGIGLLVYFLFFASGTHFVLMGAFPFLILIGIIMIVVGEDWLAWVGRLF